MNIWLTTDTHFGHEKLIEYGRPADFEEQIKTNLASRVNEGDLLIHLGDVCIGNDEENNRWFDKLGCKRYLLLGNHDNKSMQWYYKKGGWDVVAKRIDFEMYGKRIAFSHYPQAWDGYFDVNIHGHFHDTDNRRQKECEDIYCGYNKLLAVEYLHYQPITLRKFLGL